MLTKKIQQTAENRALGPISNERGAALVIALLLLAVMSILGTVLMSDSTMEIQISSNFSNKQESFYVADRALEYAMRSASTTLGDTDLFLDLNADQGSAFLGMPHRTAVNIGLGGLESVDEDGNGVRDNPMTTDDRNSVRFVNTSPPPIGSGSDPTIFETHNFVANSVGLFPTNINNPSRTELKAQFGKLVPK
jgi:hypothetical protein